MYTPRPEKKLLYRLGIPIKKRKNTQVVGWDIGDEIQIV